MKAKSDPEERKAKYYGLLFANIALMPRWTSANGHQLARRAEQLQYRQLVRIALVARRQKLSVAFPWGRLLGSTEARAEHFLLAGAIRELSDRVHETGNTGIAPFLEPLGKLLYEAMSLGEIEVDEILDAAEEIKRANASA